MTTSMKPSVPGSGATRAHRAVWMPLVAGLAVAGALVLVFFVAATEREMGDVQRIFYFHVSSAFATLLLFVGCALCSLAYLIMYRMAGVEVIATVVERIAISLGEIGVLFGIVVLVTGPLWAKPVWLVYWTWEPRLVLMLLTELIFIGYVVLRSYASQQAAMRRLAAGIAVIGGPAVYLIHIAVEKWGGNHPRVVSEGGGGLEGPGMGLAFGVTLAAMTVFVAVLVHLRYQRHKLADQIDDAWLDLGELEAP